MSNGARTAAVAGSSLYKEHTKQTKTIQPDGLCLSGCGGEESQNRRSGRMRKIDMQMASQPDTRFNSKRAVYILFVA